MTGPARVARAAVALLLAGALTAGCATTSHAGAPVRWLTLLPGPGLTVAGSVKGRPAELRLTIEEPRSRVTSACLAGAPPPAGRVRLPALEGSGWETWPEVTVAGVAVGTDVLAPLRAAVVPGPSEGCVVWLGTDVLGAAVLEVDLDARTVRLATTAASLPRGTENVVVDVSRVPDTDRLLATARLAGVSATALQTVVLGTARGTELAALTARALGAEVVLRSVQLVPGWEACDVPVRPRTAWGRGPVVGVLGPEAWGASRAVLDLGRGRLTLVRRAGAPPPPCRDGEAPTDSAGSAPGPEPEPR